MTNWMTMPEGGFRARILEPCKLPTTPMHQLPAGVREDGTYVVGDGMGIIKATGKAPDRVFQAKCRGEGCPFCAFFAQKSGPVTAIPADFVVESWAAMKAANFFSISGRTKGLNNKSRKKRRLEALASCVRRGSKWPRVRYGSC